MKKSALMRRINPLKVVPLLGFFLGVTMTTLMLFYLPPFDLLIIVLFSGVVSLTVGLLVNIFFPKKYAFIMVVFVFFLILLRAFNVLNIINLGLLLGLLVILFSLL
ncbi:hypothetical protein A2690_04070 [Candidatus Roizmanbacteria bacterium RIFCSPHIGHO2_01_FULL_39_12b]|uniref:Uncharacterized protein n=1 Tax=Candidatus Roizmanbacteria bacterium RIFCSPHIGHO2_01_FULL_39_12b TaxID=1802030 RepID=A0A1F7GC93_9BACT|nr:MAG: hypothetical protein A2690_04070 [Candidatus Roizmanbacteria bacterium RIFCSPHIGHO2_01_FULL_39_12b]OGK47118.1 MAG: hypothetical protein A3B46_01795 [Candidatus Roizmanbacteria bacterium RIFCSPLOWO2_01_FULL_39_19]